MTFFFAGNYQENIIAVKKNCSSSRIGFSVCVFFFQELYFVFFSAGVAVVDVVHDIILLFSLFAAEFVFYFT